ncbi:hypothetical protein L861_18185 [Litchfieldella anticariensis FP35 = DSM 16096]|uniref:Tryptophan synthase subunit beta like protein n=1 Tax=Litchfieldella anticariensis (strain DSM 16096 / CECT 5854 / CIP 108499 / LMG 22089 / FP35) TaxID=1121939 RepID=S2KSJ5_LITA3|nr:hypothetical protein [Halomonas anticariensis]EPC03468.1 hypothetical protein L861_18185 [Halomonas anticariensis FP35 = DSM 16096]
MYVKRDEQDRIELVSGGMTPDCREGIAPDSPELLAFLKQDQNRQLQELRSTDLEFVRVLEDVIELLMDKGVISFTDLPDAAREKLMARQSLRRRVNSVDLLDENDDEDNGLI